ncbi:MAG: hypothetical protein KJ630_01200 [Proteobacteria bacterium]|nr:hypothetical protein [Pseudomonadota bacterium]
MMITINSKKEGFRRCGVAHPARPTEYPNGRFSKKELALLQEEPMLVVTVTEDVKEVKDQTKDTTDKKVK